ncbi:hypothetical protein RN001_002811 [Aquatica leii]|uniref:Tyr recombinase domain-containing protein n=1 Tax=Aquatica leii TaxID=1421715 RepID=A0AAN7PE15_9COLE|nr:hypothetical protein RN001_002811 [Aquatica leii]
MNIPDHIKKSAEEAVASILPTKSANRYNDEYKKFIKWCNDNTIIEYSEVVLLAYFKTKSETLKASTLWTTYSMLKSTLSIKHNINISKYSKLVAFLKRQNDLYQPKKSQIFTEKQIETFLQTASNEKFLLIKTALIIAISGACRKSELTNLSTDAVQFLEHMLVIKLCDTKNKCNRTFVINNKPWINIVCTYYNLRPPNIDHKRFFIYYCNNKCTRQPVGVNTFGSMSRKIAEFLQLSNAKSFTGHCFRRTSATLLSGKGASFLDVKRHGGWKSSTVAEGYIEDSLHDKITIADQLTSGSSQPSTSCNELSSTVCEKV